MKPIYTLQGPVLQARIETLPEDRVDHNTHACTMREFHAGLLFPSFTANEFAAEECNF